MNDLYTLCEAEKKSRHSIIRVTPNGRHRVEDVARHNSLDEVIGEMVFQDISPNRKAP